MHGNGALRNNLSDLRCRMQVTRGGADTGESSSPFQGVRQRMTGIEHDGYRGVGAARGRA